jgi:hypothetical protein
MLSKINVSCLTCRSLLDEFGETFAHLLLKGSVDWKAGKYARSNNFELWACF